MLQRVPGEHEEASQAASGAVRSVVASVARATDDCLIVGASAASGISLGLGVASGPRLLVAGSELAPVVLSASLIQRHPRRYGTRNRGALAS